MRSSYAITHILCFVYELASLIYVVILDIGFGMPQIQKKFVKSLFDRLAPGKLFIVHQ